MADVRPGTATARRPAALEEHRPAEPSLGDLVAKASKDLSTLVRSEIELAKLELTAEAKKAVIGGGMFGVAAVLGVFALIMLSFAAAFGIASLGLANGWAFLIVGGAYLLIALVLVFGGTGSMKKIGPPKRTIRTTKDTVAALKKAGRPAGE